MSIIVEGCDGAGKTFLIQQLQYAYPDLVLHERFSTSRGGPVDHLATRVYQDRKKLESGAYIYDRHPIISEYIYGHAIPSRAVDPEFLSYHMYQVQRHIEMHSFTVFCIPPLSQIHQNAVQEAQMPGVIDNLEKIYEGYRIRTITWHGESAVYDYTTPTGFDYLRARIDSWMYQQKERKSL